MLELNEKNFAENVAEGKTLVFFYRESGCSFCDKAKPVFEELEGDFKKAKYKLGPQADSVTNGLVFNFPTFGAFVDGKLVGSQEGFMSAEKMAATFEAGIFQPKPKAIPLEQANSVQLMNDRLHLIDQIGPLRKHLAMIEKEIARREKMALGKVDCCDSCADGGGCDGGCH
jgi:thiol-disulfide isomerase/thioredoxin